MEYHIHGISHSLLNTGAAINQRLNPSILYLRMVSASTGTIAVCIDHSY